MLEGIMDSVDIDFSCTSQCPQNINFSSKYIKSGKNDITNKSDYASDIINRSGQLHPEWVRLGKATPPPHHS